jgi:hypothetical protein
MQTLRQKLVASYPPEEQAEAERMAVKISSNPDSPLLWFLLQNRQTAKELPEKFQKEFSTYLAAGQSLKAEIGGRGVWIKIIFSKILTIIVAITIGAGAYYYLQTQQEHQLSALTSTLSELSASAKHQEEQNSILIKNQKSLADAQGIYQDRLNETAEKGLETIKTAEQSAVDTIRKADKSAEALNTLGKIMKIRGVGMYNDPTQDGLSIFLPTDSFMLRDAPGGGNILTFITTYKHNKE